MGYIVGVSTSSIPGRYLSMFLMASGSAGKSCVSDADGNITSIVLLGFALTLVWVSNAIPRPPAKRSAAMAIVNGFGNIGSLYVR